jgi:hypothetical protein
MRFTAAPGEESPTSSTRLTNVGTQPFRIEGLTLDDGERSSFVIYGVGSDIPPGETVEIQVAFRPDPRKSTSDRLRVIGSFGTRVNSISLRGKVVSPQKAQEGRASTLVEEARQWKYPPAPTTYAAMFDALAAASELMDGDEQRPDPFDYSHARELAEPVVRELEEVASLPRIAALKRNLDLNGVTQQLVDARIGNAKLAARTFLERSILGGSINGAHTLHQFEVGREEILLLTGEKKPEASELKRLDAAGDKALNAHLIGYAAVVAAPALAALAVEAAPLAAAQAASLWLSSRAALTGLSTWALANPTVATELAGIALGLGLEIGEFGISGFLSQLETPEGTAFVLLQLFTHYVSVRGAAADWENAGSAPRNPGQAGPDDSPGDVGTTTSTRSASTTADDAVREAAEQLAAFVEVVKTKRAASGGPMPAHERADTPAPGGGFPSSGPRADRVTEGSAELGGTAVVAPPSDSPVASGAPAARVTAPVEGLFDGVPARLGVVFYDAKLGGIEATISDRTRPGSGGKLIVTTTVTMADGRVGLIERAYDPKTKTFEMMNAFLDSLPSWVAEPGVPAMSAKGVPTVTYLTLRQMKMLDVPYGQLSRVKMSTIQNVRGILELNVAMKAGADPNDAILNTHSVQYASTAIQQSGHRVVSAEVVFRGKTRFSEMLEHYETDPLTGAKNPDVVAKHDDLISEYGKGAIGRDSEVEWNYDIYLNVAPFGGEP